TAHADADRTRRGMARHAYHPHVVHEVFAAELGADTALLAYLQYFRLPFQVAEGTAPLVAARRKRVVISGRRLLHGREVGLGGCTADNHCKVVGRTGRRSEVLNLLPNEFRERLLVEQRLGLLVKE